MKTARILKLEPYEGDDSYLRVGWSAKNDAGDDEAPMDAMFVVVIVDTDTFEVSDYGYASYADAKAAWPEAT